MDPTVMLDLIPDVQGSFPAAGRRYEQVITLPNIECTNCTLQLTQMMTDKPPYTTALTSDDIYYQCADLVLSASAPPPMVDAGVPNGDAATTDPGGTSGGCTTTRGASGGALIFVGGALGLVLARRRRR
jgi:hypothetical protein